MRIARMEDGEAAGDAPAAVAPRDPVPDWQTRRGDVFRLDRLRPGQGASILCIEAPPLPGAAPSGIDLAGLGAALPEPGPGVAALAFAPRDPAAPTGLADLVAEILAAVDAVRVGDDPVALVGRGAGAVLALLAAATRPSAVAALALLDCGVDAAPRGAPAEWLDGIGPEGVAAFRRLAPPLRRWFAPPAGAAPRDAAPDWLALHGLGLPLPLQRDWRRMVGDNALMRGGLVLGGQPVDPGRIACPVLACFPEEAAAACRPLAGLVASEDYTETTPGADPAGTVAAWLAARLA